MSAEDAHVNTPAVAWAWLTSQLANLDEMPGRSIGREWRRFRSEMDGRQTPGTYITEWPSDFWIAKTQRLAISEMVAAWSIPERLDQWPLLEVTDPVVSAFSGRKTNSASFLELLANADPMHAELEDDPLRRFYELIDPGVIHPDTENIIANQIRAWLTTAFGDLLTGIALTPIDDNSARDLIVQEIMGRISDIESFDSGVRQFGIFDYDCDILYNTQITRDGLQWNPARQGQGTDWQHHWMWLSAPQDARAMKAALRLSGLLLINEPLLAGLTLTVREGSEYSQKRALCVTRRWSLTCKVLAWLVEALQQNWTDVRPQDLACFAFGALSPAWPRRAVAVSHRSADAKPLLTGLKMWQSPHVAIDASYVPAWETNTGMIWSLFAPVPLIARVESPAYHESEWCRREHEMSQYLIDHADFLEERAILDLSVDKLVELDASLFEGTASGDVSGFELRSALSSVFPPFSLVLIGAVPSEIDLAILRAAGALRLVHALVQDPAVANKLASRAAAGDDIDIEAPTNNPGGWAAYGELFRDLEAVSLPGEQVKRSMLGKLRGRAARRLLPLRVPDDYSALDLRVDRVSARQIPDLSEGQYRLADVLAAFEWRRTVLEWFKDEEFGDKVAVDVAEFSAEDWNTQPHFSVARGLLALYGFSPVWIMQRAGQSAHQWPGFREQPIFTQHVDQQFSWLKPVITYPTWLIYYLANSGLAIEAELQAAMIAAVVHSAGSEALELQRNAEGVGLAVPQPREFFGIPDSALREVYDRFDIPTDPQAQ